MFDDDSPFRPSAIAPSPVRLGNRLRCVDFAATSDSAARAHVARTSSFSIFDRQLCASERNVRAGPGNLGSHASLIFIVAGII
jgi:hypothetical protein